ncbi:MAG: acyltransferase [Alphaproteobacteria bacterium]|nr:acyltransferase [Alphaproteobacteria bacterium]
MGDETPNGSRVHSLDGLRAASISLVMVGHFTKMTMFPGGFGVTVFFVISGFLITHLLLKEMDRTGTIDRWAFYKRRVFRLLPAIVVSMIGVALLQSYVDGIGSTRREPWLRCSSCKITT